MVVNLIRNECRSEFAVLCVGIAENDGEFELAQEVGEQVIAVVEFAVSERHRVEVKLVQSLGDFSPLKSV